MRTKKVIMPDIAFFLLVICHIQCENRFAAPAKKSEFESLPHTLSLFFN